MISTIPTANVVLPSQSTCARCRSPSSRNATYPHTVPSSPTGTDTRKMRCQSKGASSPPTISPMKVPLKAAAWLTPMASPRWSRGKASVRMAEEFAISIAAPSAWKSRMMMSQSPAA